MSKSLSSPLYCSLNNSSNSTEYKSQHYRPVKMNSLSLGKPVSNNMVDCALFTSDTVPSAFCSPEIHQTQESPADAVKPARRKSMQKLLQFDVFRFISPNSISPMTPNFKV